jgi:hypothetical protein
MIRYLLVLALLHAAPCWCDEEQLRDPTAPIGAATQAVVQKNVPSAHRANKPQWNLGGVLVSEDGKKALLNGRWYKEQEFVDGWQLAEIESSAVVLKRVGRTQKISMFPKLSGNAVGNQPE